MISKKTCLVRDYWLNDLEVTSWRDSKIPQYTAFAKKNGRPLIAVGETRAEAEAYLFELIELEHNNDKTIPEESS
tara:strand:+ start:130 stop:354 length:225 start_codon:yes stop_codon:yes gene_type:complete